MQWSFLAVVALAGGVGAVARYLLAFWLKAAWPELPLATAIVNVAGCLGFGVCWGLAAQRWSAAWSAAVLVGFFGAFTTFSSFAFECHELLAARRFVWFAVDLLGQNALGLTAMAAGIGLGGMLRSA
jgi:fluoride exporter